MCLMDLKLITTNTPPPLLDVVRTSLFTFLGLIGIFVDTAVFSKRLLDELRCKLFYATG